MFMLCLWKNIKKYRNELWNKSVKYLLNLSKTNNSIDKDNSIFEMAAEELDFLKICRVCCLEGKTMPIFKVHISRKLMSCTSVQVFTVKMFHLRPTGLVPFCPFGLGVAKRRSAQSNLHEMRLEITHCISVQKVGRKIRCTPSATIAISEPNSRESSKIIWI